MNTSKAPIFFLRRRAAVSQFTAALTVLLGLIVLAGWILDVPILKSVIPGAVQMKANTAVGLILAGASLFLHLSAPPDRLDRLALVLACVVAALGMATLGEYTYGWQLRIDELLFRDTASASNLVRGRMSLFSAMALTAIGVALVCLRLRGLRTLAWLAAVFVVAIGGSSLIGYLWNVPDLITDNSPLPVAVNSAIAFVVLGVGAFLATPSPWAKEDAVAAAQSIETKILAGFVASLALLLVGGGYIYRSSVDFADSARWVAHSQQVRAAISNLYATVSNAESAQRNYLITGQKEQLDEYGLQMGKATERLDQIGGLITDDPEQLRNREELTRLVATRFDWLRRGVERYRTSGFDGARNFISSGEGIETMALINNVTDRMEEAEETLLVERQASLTYRRQVTLISILITIAIAAAVLSLLYRGIRREMVERAKARAELGATNRFLDSVIENIPNLISIKDAAELRYVRLNRAGEELLGLSRHEVLGKTAFDIFPREEATFFTARDRDALVQSEARETLEHPVTTRDKGIRIIHSKRIPLPDSQGAASFLLGISEDVTARKEAEERIRSLNEELKQRATQVEAINKELEAFSYSISHDLRAPLRHIQGYVQMLVDETSGRLGEEASRHLEVISKASVQMGELIDDLLLFSRMGRTDMHRTRVELNAMVRESIEQLEIALRGRNVEWKIDPLPVVDGDPSMLRQVFANLIGNAVKYSGPRDPAKIRIGCSGEQDGWATLFVRDNGVGFDMRYASKLFGVFQRLHRADEFEGTGIGLANVHRIISRHGGRVWAEAVPDQGATFYFTLKASKAD